MWNWHISIQGIGSHHQNYPKDANVMAAELVKALKAAGHTVEEATFTHGGKEDLDPPRSGGAILRAAGETDA